MCSAQRVLGERAGVCTQDVRYEGRMKGVVDVVPTEVKLIVPANPKVPEFEEVVMHAFELLVVEAHRTAARRAMREVHAQLRDKLVKTPYRCLPRAYREPRDFESSASQFTRTLTLSLTRNFAWPPAASTLRTWHCSGWTVRWRYFASGGTTVSLPMQLSRARYWDSSAI